MTNKKILLTIAPVYWPKIPPLGIAYLEAYLTDKSINVEVLDLNNFFYNLADTNLKKSWEISCNTYLENNILSIIESSFKNELNKKIDEMIEYEIIGFSCFKSNFKTTLEIIKILKSKKSSIKIILGGPEISRQYFKTNKKFSDYLIDIADLIVVGEGERPILEYLTTQNNEKIVESLQLDSIENISFPKHLKINSYPKKNAIPIMFSRGCVRKCNFCSERLIFKGFRSRAVKSVIAEIKFHKDRGVNYFIFFDSMLNADLKKLENLCDEIIENFGHINWEAQIAIRNEMHANLLEKIKKSGCYNLFIGLESGSESILKKMNKGFTKNDAEVFFNKLNSAKLFFGISLIVGYPEETDAEFHESLDFLIKNKSIIPKIEQINPFTYYDGTNTDKNFDYKKNELSLKKMEIFIEEIKKNNFKFTKAFLGNLMEKDCKIND